MRRFCKSSRKSKKEEEEEGGRSEMVIDWEIRPGGMLVQKRITTTTTSTTSAAVGSSSSAILITIRVSHDSCYHHLTLPSQSTFGDLKKLLALETSLEPKEQRLLFRGKEKADDECLHMVGVKDMSKVVLLEDPASKERKLKEMRENQAMVKTYEAVAKVRAEVDELSKKVAALETSARNGARLWEKELDILTEQFMVQLLKLDGIDAEGETKTQRRIEVRRVQSFVDKLDSLKAKNANYFNGGSFGFPVHSKWAAFDPGLGILGAHVTTRVTHDWEQFD